MCFGEEGPSQVDPTHSIFVWNGDSPGTRAGYDYMVSRGKTAHLVRLEADA